MKAVLCKSLEGSAALVIDDVPVPEPGPGDVRVRVHACALNFFDTLITRGKYQYKPQLPFSPAGEIAGVVDAVGPGVDMFKIGQRVCGFIGWGGARTFAIARADALIAIPDGVADEIAAGVSVTYGTAMHGLIDRGRLKPGDTVAVLGASGGAGLAAVEIAKLMGARVIAAASSDDKLGVCTSHGADVVLNYTTCDLKQGLRDLTDGRGPDVIYDCVGGDHAEPALRAIGWMGRYLVIGFAGGQIPKVPLNLPLLKSCDIIGVFWGEVALRNPAAHTANIARVLAWIAEGALKPHVHAVMPIDQIVAALGMLDRREVTGKLVLAV